jgi:hypothetical protein
MTFTTILYSLLGGFICLNDLEYRKEDPLFEAVTLGGIDAITAGDFLRSFLTKGY